MINGELFVSSYKILTPRLIFLQKDLILRSLALHVRSLERKRHIFFYSSSSSSSAMTLIAFSTLDQTLSKSPSVTILKICRAKVRFVQTEKLYTRTHHVNGPPGD